MGFSFLEIVLLMMGSFRLTRLICFDKITSFLRNPFLEEVVIEEDGNVQTYWKLKGTKGVRKFFGELLSCYWCTGVWCAIFLTLGTYYYGYLFEPFVVILAIAGGGSIIETLISRYID